MVTREDAEAAVDTLVRFVEASNGDLREGLARTPERVIDSFTEIYGGYGQESAEVLDSTFNGEGYDGIVLLRDIEFHSTCEHHLQPFHGRAHVTSNRRGCGSCGCFIKLRRLARRAFFSRQWQERLR
uniref:GTP cyclohydrolase I n=1 Tax=uncultured marine group II/III euryarchaeote KM3_149_A03 TaxID=1457884 RepID=A0A075GBQ0_9EURY|nr:GTP cyclohydrolase I (folE) [uncultured marine group II/III euryarchaeote KM3_149_A03]